LRPETVSLFRDPLDKEIQHGFRHPPDTALGDAPAPEWPSMFIRAKP
jgi:hypothetical protein